MNVEMVRKTEKVLVFVFPSRDLFNATMVCLPRYSRL